MKHEHRFFVKTASPPTVEVDSRASAVYLRFKKTSVAKTIAQECPNMHIAVDLDSKGEVVGIEAVGITEFTIQFLLEKASVSAPKLDYSRANYVPTPEMEAA